MKKAQLTVLVLALLIVFSTPISAAAGESINIYIDGRLVPMESVSTSVNYYLDIPPQLIGDRVFVPLRTMCRYFDIEIEWHNPNVLLSRDDTIVVLTPGSTTIQLNGISQTLHEAPYIENGRTMAPIRLISEAFNCEVSYELGDVYITTPQLVIEGRSVISIQSLFMMTDSTIMEESKTSICINKYYQFLQDIAIEEIDAPLYFTERIPDLDILFSYLMIAEYSFMETTGLGGSVIRQYKTYQRIDALGGSEPLQTGVDYGPYIICDVKNNVWYRISEGYPGIAGDIYSLGDWERHSW